MQLKNKKEIKAGLTVMLDKALKYYHKNYNYDDKMHNKTVANIIKRIIEVIESIKSPRIPEQNSSYHIFLLYMHYATPDYYREAYNKAFKRNRKVFSKDYWHSEFKDLYNIKSTAFDKLDGYEFTEYYNNCVKDAAYNIFHTTIDQLKDDVEDFYDDYKRGKILY